MDEKLALVVIGGEKEKLLWEALSQAGWVELRIDRFLRDFPESQLAGWLKRIKSYTSGKLIATVRWVKEQSAPPYRISEEKRESLFRLVLPEVDYVDLEIRSNLARKILPLAHQQGKKVILSYHNFKGFPSVSVLMRLYRKFRFLQGDILKVAVRVNSPGQLLNLINFTACYSQKSSLVIVPMGTSLLERVLPLSFGSLFTYAGLSQAVAPGQPTFRQWQALRNLLLTER